MTVELCLIWVKGTHYWVRDHLEEKERRAWDPLAPPPNTTEQMNLAVWKLVSV